ncbi:hypothetical protein CK203_024865 [Vitis vinifera]|uniref:Uncharacterized protein n=1 Tax=Vitis vinifera TaxID=29760 RepID=A0A438ITK0_VITVI|nr:hypothetical protein CK203_024865 [Vitis vinifera]
MHSVMSVVASQLVVRVVMGVGNEVAQHGSGDDGVLCCCGGAGTWWEQHFWTVVVGVIITLILGLSTFGVWFVWKWRQNAVGTYKPIGARVPEQELQQLTLISSSQA